MLAVICHNLNIADKVTGIIKNAVGGRSKWTILHSNWWLLPCSLLTVSRRIEHQGNSISILFLIFLLLQRWIIQYFKPDGKNFLHCASKITGKNRKCQCLRFLFSKIAKSILFFSILLLISNMSRTLSRSPSSTCGPIQLLMDICLFQLTSTRKAASRNMHSLSSFPSACMKPSSLSLHQRRSRRRI